MMLEDELVFAIKDKEIMVKTNKEEISIIFNTSRFRPTRCSYIIIKHKKNSKLGFEINYTLEDMIEDQLNYYLKKENRE